MEHCSELLEFSKNTAYMRSLGWKWRHDFGRWRQISWHQYRRHFVSDIKKARKMSTLCEKVGIFDNGGQFVRNQGVN